MELSRTASCEVPALFVGHPISEEAGQTGCVGHCQRKNQAISSGQCGGWSHETLGNLARLVFSICLSALLAVMYLWKTTCPPALEAPGNPCLYTQTSGKAELEKPFPQLLDWGFFPQGKQAHHSLRAVNW